MRRGYTCAPTTSHDYHLWNRNDELAPVPAEFILLGQNFGGEIPGEQQNVVWPGFEQDAGGKNRRVIARRKAALLQIAAIDDELNEPPVDAERIHEGAALGRCPNRRTHGAPPRAAPATAP